jgi:transcription elongation factor/antiterminator RfaH
LTLLKIKDVKLEPTDKMTLSELKYSWYVLHTKSRFENVVNEGLIKKSMEVFLPKVQVRSKRRDRKVMIRVPLFPGYLFVKTNLEPVEHLEIVKTVGVVRLIGNKEGPVSVPSDTIDSLKIMVKGDNTVTTGTRFRKGDRVIVVYGPFAGVIGTFARYRGKGRVIVDIEALGQYAGVDVSEEDIEILPEILS